MFFIIIIAVHVSGRFFCPSSGAYKTVFQPIHTSGKHQESMTIPKVHIQFYKLLMMGGKTARNM